MSKLLSKEYQTQILTLFGTVVVQGLMIVAVRVLQDIGAELATSKKARKFKVTDDGLDFEDIIGEDALPKKDRKLPRDRRRPPDSE